MQPPRFHLGVLGILAFAALLSSPAPAAQGDLSEAIFYVH